MLSISEEVNRDLLAGSPALAFLYAASTSGCRNIKAAAFTREQGKNIQLGTSSML